MSRTKTFVGGLSALALGLTGLAVSAQPAAAAVGCGSTITVSTTLTADVGPCTTDGLIVKGNNFTLNLNGKRVFAKQPAIGDIVGIRLGDRTGVATGVKVINGTVDGFNGGVSIIGGSGNTIKGITAVNNISDFGPKTAPKPPATAVCDNGDGISLFGSSNNLITGNTANHNGPYGGISVVNNSGGNRIIGNVANDNNIIGIFPNGDHPPCIDNQQQDEGIRIEGPGADNNQVKYNTVDNNLFAGIGIHAANNITANELPNTKTVIVGNTVQNNGNSSADDSASGISILGTPGVRAFGNTISSNVVTLNAADGIYLPAESHDNLVQDNVVNANKKDGIFLEGPSFGNIFTNIGPSLLQVTRPQQAPFVECKGTPCPAGSQYFVLSGSGSGDVTARLVPVGPINVSGTIPRDTVASGCSPSDFAGFPAGSIALVQRGFCDRTTKVTNALAAGAVGVVMFNEGSTGRTGVLTSGVDPTTIPVVGTSFAVGQQLFNLTKAGPVTVHLVTKTTNVRVQTGPGAENNKLLGNRGTLNLEHDGHDSNLTPPCDNNMWSANLFGTVNQACVATGGTGTVKP